MSALLAATENGLHCAAGDFFIDPWRPVPRALITHAHSDHARRGSSSYLCAAAGAGVLRARLGAEAKIQPLPYGEPLVMNGVRVSFHPAGHVLGSAQIRIEHGGEVWVASGDYKRQADPTCAAFEPLRCHTFITESTFGLPLYRWPEPCVVMDEIHDWWRANQREGRTSVLYAYSLGKAQRLLAGLDAACGPLFVHRGIHELLPAYEAEGVRFPSVRLVEKSDIRSAGGAALVLAPPAVDSTGWLNGLGEISTAFASGWMLIRGSRRRLSADRGFVVSDHADWPALVGTIRETGAERVLVTHGSTGPMVRWLRESGWDAAPLRTQYHDKAEEA